jgi:hypothetical protein
MPDMPYDNMLTLGCPKCHRYLETTTDLNPVQFGGGFGNQRCTFFGGTKSGAIAHGATMESLQFFRDSTTETRSEISEVSLIRK